MDRSAWMLLDPQTATPSRRRGVIEEILDDEAILLDSPTGLIHRLNETALAVWRRCDGHTTIHRIAEGMSERYEVDLEYALDHVDQLIALFAEAGLVELQEVKEEASR